LRGFFESCGKVLGARVAYNPEGQPRGFAHVDFASPDSVEKAVAKTGSKLDGREIRVDYSSGKKQDGGGFRGGNQGGFSGQKRGPPGGGRMNLGEEDAAKKKGAISSFQGQKQRL